MTFDTSYEPCPKCNEPSPPGKRFCADCGAPLDSQSAQIRALIDARVDRAFETRFKDQRYVALETSVAAADKLTGWLKLFLYWAAIPLALIAILLGILGFRTYSDFTSKVTAAEKQVESVSAAARETAEAAQQKAADVSKALARIELEVTSSQRALSDLQRIAAGTKEQYGQLELDVGRYKHVNQKIEEVQKELTDVKGQIVDFGKRKLRAETLIATGSGGPSYEAILRLGCPTLADLAKDNAPVAYCTQGSPPSLFQLSSTGLRAVSSLSPAGFQDVSTASRPTCTAANRGTFYVEKGTGSMADKALLCGKKSDNTYDWIQLGMLP